VSLFHLNPTISISVQTVVVGNATVLASKSAPRIISLAAVPVISTISDCQCDGVPVRLVDISVMFTASAVILCMSLTSVSIVGVADDVSDVTFGNAFARALSTHPSSLMYNWSSVFGYSQTYQAGGLPVGVLIFFG
jgi:hypothetical protein